MNFILTESLNSWLKGGKGKNKNSAVKSLDRAGEKQHPREAASNACNVLNRLHDKQRSRSSCRGGTAIPATLGNRYRTSVHTSVSDYKAKVCHFGLECFHSMSEINFRIHAKRNRFVISALRNPAINSTYINVRERSSTNSHNRKMPFRPRMEAMFLGSGPNDITNVTSNLTEATFCW